MNPPYGLIPICIAVLLLYAVSWGMVRLDVFRKVFHRKIWNYLLLLTFLISGLLGIILAVQVNYKLNIPGIEKILKWHVDFGIAMVIAAIIHIIWHFSYFTSFFTIKHSIPQSTKKIKTADSGNEVLQNKKLIITALFVAGFTGILSQLLVLRELLNIFQGNELVIGIIFSIWMLLTSAGSGLFNKRFLISNRLKALLLLILRNSIKFSIT